MQSWVCGMSRAIVLVLLMVMGTVLGASSGCSNATAGINVRGITTNYTFPIAEGKNHYLFQSCIPFPPPCEQSLVCKKFFTTDGRNTGNFKVGDLTELKVSVANDTFILLSAPPVPTGGFGTKRAADIFVKCGSDTGFTLTNEHGLEVTVSTFLLISNDHSVCSFFGKGKESFIMAYPFSLGWTFFMCCIPLFLCSIFWYLVIGIAVKIKVYEVPYQPVSIDLLPNKSFWMDWPFMVKDAHIFVFEKVKMGVMMAVAKVQSMRKGSYEEV